MPLPILRLPGQWEITERSYKVGDPVALGEGYRQTYKNLKQRRSWDVATVGPKAAILAVHEALLDYRGDQEFLWSPDSGPDNGGSVPIGAYRCKSWEIAQIGPGVLGLSGVFESAPGGECEAYKARIDLADLAPVVEGVVAWLTAGDPITLGRYCKAETAANLITTLCNAARHAALSEEAKSIAKAKAIELGASAQPVWFGGSPQPGKLFVPHSAVANQALPDIGPMGPIASVSGHHNTVVDCNYNTCYLPATAYLIGDMAIHAEPDRDRGAGRNWLQALTASPMPLPADSQGETDEPGRYPVAYLVRAAIGGGLERVSPDGSVSAAQPGDTPGLVRLDASYLWAPVSLSWAENTGVIPIGSPMGLHPWPHSEGLMRELNPVAIWAWCRAFEGLAAIDPGGPWQAPITACRNTAINLCRYAGDNRPRFWQRDPSLRPFDFPGTGHRSAEDRAIHLRLANGALLSQLGSVPANDPERRLAYWWQTVTEWVLGNGLTRLSVDIASTVETTVSLAASTVRSPALVGKMQGASDWVCPLLLGATVNLQTAQNSPIEVVRRQFIRWAKSTIWHPQIVEPNWLFDPYWGVVWPGPGGSVVVKPAMSVIDGVTRFVTEIYLSQTGSYAGIDLAITTFFGQQLESPPEFCYRMVNLNADGDEIQGGLSARLAGRNYSRLHKFELQPTDGEWAVRKFEWSERLPWNGGNDNRTDWGIGFDERDGWSGFRVETNPGPSHRCKISIWWIGAPPEELPEGAPCYRLTISTDESRAYDLAIGDVVATTTNPVPRSGVGLAIHGAEATDGEITRAGAGIRAGAIYPADQSPAQLYEWGPEYWQDARSQLLLIADAQTAYSKQSPTDLGGPLCPALRLPWWSEPALPPLPPTSPPEASNATINRYNARGNGGGYDVWGWAGYEPAERLTNGLLTYKATANVAETWANADRLSLGSIDRNAAKSIVMAALRWLDSATRGNDPPMVIGQSVAPASGAADIRSLALCLKAAVWANLAGADPGVTYRLAVRLQDRLLVKYQATPAGAVPWATAGASGLSTADQVAGAIAALDALSLLAAAKPDMTVPPCSTPL